MAIKQEQISPWFAGITRYHLLVFLGCWLGGIFDGMDSTLMHVVLPKAVGELIGSTAKEEISQIGAYVTAIFLFGWTLGGIFIGWLGDRLGRVKAMILSILLYATFTGLSGFAQSWEHLAVCRFLTGLGIGGELVSITTFLAEVWPSRSRAVAIGVLITSYQAGVFIAGSISYLFPDWRMVFFIGALPALLVIFLRMALKESDRWIEAKEKAMQVAETPSQFSALLQKQHARNLLVGSFAFGGLLVGYWASLAWIPTWIQSLLSDTAVGNVERSTAVMYQGVFAVIGCSLAGVFSDAIGRRWTVILSFAGCLIASAILFLTNQTFSELIYFENALLGFFIGLAQAVMYIYLPELFPTLIRATGVGFCLNMGRIVTVVAVLFIGVLVSLFGSYAMAAFTFSLAYLVGMLAGFLGKETRNQPLPE